MKKLIILQGPPASGKSTWVKEFEAEMGSKTSAPSYKIVSRDVIRHSFGEYNMEHEDEVTKLEDAQTINGMEDGVEIIINDATNLNPKYLPHWEKMAAEYGYEVEYKQFYVPFEEAVKRDENEDRAHHVGKKVIKRYYRMYFPEKLEEESRQTVDHKRIPIDETLPKVVLCDIDGTVAWMQGRSPYDRKTVSTDKGDPRMFQLLQILMEAGVFVIFVSGREGTEQCRHDTINWIYDQLSISYTISANSHFDLLMRKEHDYRPDEIIKKEIYENQIKGKCDVIAVFDDRNKVVNMWREVGMLCCQVNDGDF